MKVIEYVKLSVAIAVRRRRAKKGSFLRKQLIAFKVAQLINKRKSL